MVLDSFAGSGSCGRAALTLGREFIGIELDSGWCEVARAACAKPHASRVLRPAVDPMQCDLF